MPEIKKYKLKKAFPALLPQTGDYQINYQAELNPAQLEAVMTLDGPVLVIAGAGSGKTRTLVYRVARLVESGVDPKSILLLTFIRKAAGEMLRRAAEILDERCAQVSGGTFHSFAALILRKYAGVIGYPNNFSIIDQSDAEDIVNIIRKDLKYHEIGKRFPKKSAILDIISKSINKGESVRQVIAGEYPHFSEFTDQISKISSKYQQFKKARAVMDYDDLLVNFVQLLKKDEAVRRKLSAQYSYIMVDEYQDTNRLQAEMASLLASEHGNIMAVGDDAQSIYSFRGANIRHIHDFPRIFPGAKIITLEENYRSTQPILDMTNNIIALAREKYAKQLFTKNTGGDLPVFLEAADEQEQSRFVAQKILELREDGVSLADIAVLFRAGWHANDLEIELARRNIPFVKYGGLKFMEAAHVKDALAFLKIIFNHADTVSWLRALLLIEGIGPKKAGEIADQTSRDRTGFTQLQALSVRYPKQKPALEGLHKVMTSASQPAVKPPAAMEMILDFYEPIFRAAYDDHHRRKSDLDSLRRMAEKYDNLEKLLTDLALEPVETVRPEPEPDQAEEKLTLSTIHSAKGLEWQAVFLIFMNDGFLPSSRSLDSEDQIEEERRLLYVAATRAKKHLFAIKPNMEFSGRGYFDDSFYGLSRLSRFLAEDDIIDRFFDHWSLAPDESGEEFDFVENIEESHINGENSHKSKSFSDNELEYLDIFE